MSWRTSPTGRRSPCNAKVRAARLGYGSPAAHLLRRGRVAVSAAWCSRDGSDDRRCTGSDNRLRSGRRRGDAAPSAAMPACVTRPWWSMKTYDAMHNNEFSLRILLTTFQETKSQHRVQPSSRQIVCKNIQRNLFWMVQAPAVRRVDVCQTEVVGGAWRKSAVKHACYVCCDVSPADVTDDVARCSFHSCVK